MAIIIHSFCQGVKIIVFPTFHLPIKNIKGYPNSYIKLSRICFRSYGLYEFLIPFQTINHVLFSSKLQVAIRLISFVLVMLRKNIKYIKNIKNSQNTCSIRNLLCFRLKARYTHCTYSFLLVEVFSPPEKKCS